MIESKGFYRRIERVFAGLGAARTPGRIAARLGRRMLDELRGPLALTATHAYDRKAGVVTLAGHWGASRPDLAAELQARLAAAAAGADGEPPWVVETAAGRAGVLEVGNGRGPLLALFLGGAGELRAEPTASEFASALNSLQYALRQHLHRHTLEDLFEQSRAIQLSLLPPGRFEFGPYDICAASVPAAQVGGDLYDFLPLDGETLGLALADASGHGLPAALQARDVATGLRMGVARELKVTRMVEKLNAIIHRSGLSSRFVSLVFGELELNGNFAYVNAGHPPPLVLGDGGVRELAVGGPILGPVAEVVYKLGFAHVDRGGLLAMYSDGVVECQAPDGRMFGDEGLRRWLEDWREGPGDQAVEDLYRRLEAFRGSATPEDDVTVLYVRRPRG